MENPNSWNKIKKLINSGMIGISSSQKRAANITSLLYAEELVDNHEDLEDRIRAVIEEFESDCTHLFGPSLISRIHDMIEELGIIKK
jgi:hypothetical protein